MIKHEIRSPNVGTRTVKLSPLKALRAFCLECMQWSPSEVKDCASKLCPVFPYRSGRNPERKGLGGDIGKIALKKGS